MFYQKIFLFRIQCSITTCCRKSVLYVVKEKTKWFFFQNLKFHARSGQSSAKNFLWLHNNYYVLLYTYIIQNYHHPLLEYFDIIIMYFDCHFFVFKEKDFFRIMYSLIMQNLHKIGEIHPAELVFVTHLSSNVYIFESIYYNLCCF